jgi:hypothetical protein
VALQGASPQGRGFEPHSCHCRSSNARTAAVPSAAALPAATSPGESAEESRSGTPSLRRVGRVPVKTPTVGLEPTTARSGPCALLTELSGLLAILDVVIIMYDSRRGAISKTDRANCNRERIRPRRKTHCRSRAGGKCGGRRHGTPEGPRFAYVALAIVTSRTRAHSAPSPRGPFADRRHVRKSGREFSPGGNADLGAPPVPAGDPTRASRAMSSPGVEPGLSRPQGDVLTTR